MFLIHPLTSLPTQCPWEMETWGIGIGPQHKALAPFPFPEISLFIPVGGYGFGLGFVPSGKGARHGKFSWEFVPNPPPPPPPTLLLTEVRPRARTECLSRRKAEWWVERRGAKGQARAGALHLPRLESISPSHSSWLLLELKGGNVQKSASNFRLRYLKD